MTSVLESDVRELDDTSLLAAYNSADDESDWRAVLAEAARRDRAGRQDRAEDALKAEWYDAMHAQRTEAEDYCRGWLLNPEGKRRAISEWMLWTGPAWMVQRYGSEELLAFFQRWPRLTLAEYKRQRHEAGRIQREQWRDRDPIEEASTDEQHIHRDNGTRRRERPELARDEAGALRPGQTAPQAPQAGSRGLVQRGGYCPVAAEDSTEARPAGVRPDGYVHRQRVTAPAAEVAVKEGVVVTRPGQPHVPGDQLLDTLRDWLACYAVFPSPAALDAVTLWVAHSWCRDEDGVLVFRATPRLYLLSSEPGSGKSKVLELLNLVCPAAFGLTIEPTAPGLVKTIGTERATVFIDESDVLFGSGRRREAVRAIVNAGYQRHGSYLYVSGSKATRIPVFGAMALAGLDVLETQTGDTLKALLERGVKVRMRKAAGMMPAKVSRKTGDQAARLKVFLEMWAAQERAALEDAEPEVPEGIEGRDEEIWAPLLACADAAGGFWPDRARAACLELALAMPAAGEISPAGELAALAAEIGA